MAAVTKEEILKIARLAKLSVDSDKLDDLTKDMGNIIAFADEISAAGEQSEGFDTLNGLQNAFREDTVIPSYPREDILRNAQGGEDGFFAVKRDR